MRIYRYYERVVIVLIVLYTLIAFLTLSRGDYFYTAMDTFSVCLLSISLVLFKKRYQP